MLFPWCPQVLASAVAKLYLCPAGSPSFAWTGLWGACVLVVDRSRSNPSKHIQLWNLHPPAAAASNTAAATAAAGSNPEIVPPSVPPPLDRTLNVQLYEALEYLVLHPLFHAFESDQVVIGLSFGHFGEAAEFAAKVREHVPAAGTAPRVPTVRKASLLQRISGIFSSSISATAAGASTPPPSGSPKDYSAPGSSGGGGSLSPLVGGPSSSGGGSGSGHSSVTAPSISPPHGFVHHAHAAFSSEGLLVAGGNLPLEWHGLFENAQHAIAAQKMARERSGSQNSTNNSSTPNQAAQSGGGGGGGGGSGGTPGSTAATAGSNSVHGLPVSSHSEGSPAASPPHPHAHHRQLSHHAAWTPAHSPNPSPRA